MEIRIKSVLGKLEEWKKKIEKEVSRSRAKRSLWRMTWGSIQWYNELCESSEYSKAQFTVLQCHAKTIFLVEELMDPRLPVAFNQLFVIFGGNEGGLGREIIHTEELATRTNLREAALIRLQKADGLLARAEIFMHRSSTWRNSPSFLRITIHIKNIGDREPKACSFVCTTRQVELFFTGT